MRNVHRSVALIVTALSASIVSLPAEAGTVRVESSETMPVQLIFEAELGETNQVQLTKAGEASFMVSDSGAPLTALGGCVASDPHTAICGHEFHVSYISVRLRDLADSALIAVGMSPFVDLNGGGGNDRLVVRGAHTPTIIGGGGNDLFRLRDTRYGTAVGGGGDDRLEGSARDDALRGGRGHDLLIGGRGSDGLAGGPGDDVLKGGPGRDILTGFNGDDLLVGGHHFDLIHGQAGDDLILARDRARDWITGGLGRDRARIDPALDRIGRVEVLY